MTTIDQSLLQQAGQYKQLTADEQRILVQRAQDGDKDARDQLVVCNLRLVIAAMKSYPQFMAAHFDDLYQAGIVGLLKAIDHYDSAFGTKVSSYATHWINQSMRMWIYDQNTIYVPRYLHDAAIKVHQRMEHGCHDVQALAAQTELHPSYVERAMQHLAWSYISIDCPVNEHKETGYGYSWSDILLDEHDQFEDVEREEQVRYCIAEANRLLALLKPRERQIVEMRLGLTGRDEMQISAIARHLSQSDACISGIYHRALNKMRRAACVLTNDQEAQASSPDPIAKARGLRLALHQDADYPASLRPTHQGRVTEWFNQPLPD